MQQQLQQQFVPDERIHAYPQFWQTQSRTVSGIVQNKVGIIHEGFKFVENKTKSKSTKQFKCRNFYKGCKSTVTTRIDYSIIRVNGQIHTCQVPNVDHPQHIGTTQSSSATPNGACQVPNVDHTQHLGNTESDVHPIEPVYPQFWTTKSNTVGVIYKGFKYLEKNTKAKHTKHFRCRYYLKNCKAKVTTRLDYSIIRDNGEPHTHPEETDLVDENESQSLTFSTYISQRGHLCITVDDYNFRQDVAYETHTVWTCMADKCPVMCKTAPSGLVSVTNKHTHSPKRAKNVRRGLRNQILDLAVKRPRSTPNEVVEDAIEGFDEYFNQIHVDTEKRTVTAHRLKIARNGQKLPRNRAEVFSALQTARETSNTEMKGADMIKGVDHKNSIAMFYSDRNLDLLQDNSRQVFGDGTFAYCSKYFYQMYTIHIYKGGYYIPVIHFLLPDKTKNTYIKMLQMLKVACRQRGFQIDMDFFFN